MQKKTSYRLYGGALTLLLWTFSLLGRNADATTNHESPTPSYQLFVPMVRNDPAITATPSPSQTDGQASWGATIALSPVTATVWVVNPDAGSITRIDTQRQEKTTEIPVGREPSSMVIALDGKRVYVVDRAAGNLVVVDAQSYTVTTTIPVGAEPGAVALSPTGAYAYVTVMATAEVVVIDTQALRLIKRVALAPLPYAIGVTDDGDLDDGDEKVYVTHLFALPYEGGEEATDNGRAGHITVLDAATNTVQSDIMLPPNQNGFPNLLAAIALIGNQAWVPYERAAPDLPNELTTTLFAAVSTLDLASNVEDENAYLPLNDQTIFGSPVNNPIAVVPAPDGQRLYIVLAGSDLIEVIDITKPAQPHLLKFLQVGLNPRGMALSLDGKIGYVQNYLARSVTVLDLAALTTIKTITTTHETLSPQVLRGKQLFNNATNPQLSQGGWITCASCHPDGGTDSVTWMFPDGPRQSPPLWNAGQTLPWHWSAALDEPQDVEQTIQLIQQGLGLAPGVDPAQLGAPNAGRSADLDALAAFLTQGIRQPVALAPADPTAGRALFQTAGCAACHGGSTWTSSTITGTPGALDPDGNGMVDAVLRTVGTLNRRDLRGAAGFDPPSLLGVGLTAPYLHDGSMPSLEALLRSGHPDPRGRGHGLSETDIAQLAHFLRAIGSDTLPVSAP